MFRSWPDGRRVLPGRIPPRVIRTPAGLWFFFPIPGLKLLFLFFCCSQGRASTDAGERWTHGQYPDWSSLRTRLRHRTRFRQWHKCEVPAGSGNVCFLGALPTNFSSSPGGRGTRDCPASPTFKGQPHYINRLPESAFGPEADMGCPTPPLQAGRRTRYCRSPDPMTKETSIERRLAAILAADIAGYSRLVGQDEVATLPALKAHRSRARASLRNRHQGPSNHGIRGRGGTIFWAALLSCRQ
jgi:hypothetical protein